MRPRSSGDRWLVVLVCLAACRGPIPATHDYVLALTSPPRRPGQLELVIDELESDATYQDRRMIYRESPYRLDLDPYNRWSADPRLLVTAFLRRAYVQRGYFSWAGAFARTGDVPVLSGRLSAFEEGAYRPRGRVAHAELTLELRGSAAGPIRWSRHVRRDVRMERAGPEALAKAMSQLLTEVVDETGPELVRIATEMRAAARDRGE